MPKCPLKPSWQWPQAWGSPLPLLLGQMWRVWLGRCALPITSQHEREERSEDPPPPGRARNPQEVTCGRVQRERALTCPNPLNLTDPAGGKTALALMGVAETAVKGATPPPRKQASVR